ncbi:MAG: cytochrome c biogenesis protein CcsA [Kiloniellales bacterium]
MFGLSALVALVPAALVPLRRRDGRDAVYWCVLAVAVAGPVAWASAQLGGTWRTGLSVTLWVTIAASMLLFAILAAATRHVWRLTPLMLPYMLLLAVTALVWQQAPERPLATAVPGGWLQAHILASVAAYALLTIAAVAALAVFLQERTLKSKRPSGLTHLLPSVADGEALQVRLLAACETVLGLGLLSGMAAQYLGTGTLIEFEHKTLLSSLAFLVIAGLLVAHYRTGVRGRQVARLLLVAYLLLTLAYPGVKFVTDVLLS